ncbi:hypothetical protein SKAU_G00190530 [Synaphobranchus kaupii]|uniref:Uncharacterized protein n=1 Tax=Synaphobranchus kaupii TaxID=118154 RepID=A0A9Q1IWB2_SYNKA|nr:hypothetical protein SKAU_G00190530 [Synaphobranchus kaupii]
MFRGLCLFNASARASRLNGLSECARLSCPARRLQGSRIRAANAAGVPRRPLGSARRTADVCAPLTGTFCDHWPMVRVWVEQEGQKGRGDLLHHPFVAHVFQMLHLLKQTE